MREEEEWYHMAHASVLNGIAVTTVYQVIELKLCSSEWFFFTDFIPYLLLVTTVVLFLPPLHCLRSTLFLAPPQPNPPSLMREFRL